MTNEDALNLLNEFALATQAASAAAVWATAFLTVGGEPTWDAVKDVTRSGERMVALGQKVAELETRYEEVLP